MKAIWLAVARNDLLEKMQRTSWAWVSETKQAKWIALHLSIVSPRNRYNANGQSDDFIGFKNYFQHHFKASSPLRFDTSPTKRQMSRSKDDKCTKRKQSKVIYQNCEDDANIDTIRSLLHLYCNDSLNLKEEYRAMEERLKQDYHSVCPLSPIPDRPMNLRIDESFHVTLNREHILNEIPHGMQRDILSAAAYETRILSIERIANQSTTSTKDVATFDASGNLLAATANCDKNNNSTNRMDDVPAAGPLLPCLSAQYPCNVSTKYQFFNQLIPSQEENAQINKTHPIKMTIRRNKINNNYEVASMQC